MISQNEALMFTVLGACVATSLGLTLLKFKDIYKYVMFEYNYMKHPRLVEYSGLRACEEPHKWQSATLAMRGISYGNYKICTECGTISGRDDIMCSDEVLAQLKEALKISAQKELAENAIYDRVLEYTKTYIVRYMVSNFTQELKDEAMASRLLDLAMFAIKAQQEATDKVSHELKKESGQNRGN